VDHQFLPLPLVPLRVSESMVDPVEKLPLTYGHLAQFAAVICRTTLAYVGDS